MTRLERFALIAEVADAMRSHGSWGGETHLQKATYVLQEVFGLPTDFPFILYKHGPFSFELRDELTSMQADGIVEQRPQPPYGPMYETTALSQVVRESSRAQVNRWRPAIESVATRLGPLDVARLEQISTAVFVLSNGPDVDDASATSELRQIKPHIEQAAADWAVSQARELKAIPAGR